MRWMLAALLLLPAIAPAKAYKCVGADGSVTFTDVPCSGDAEPVHIWDSKLGSRPILPPPVDDAPDAQANSSGNIHPTGNYRIDPSREGHSTGDGGMKDRCASQWPGDYVMQEHCIRRQAEAAQRMQPAIERADPQQREIMGRCANQWKDGDTYDFVMVEHCIQRQSSAAERIR